MTSKDIFVIILLVIIFSTIIYRIVKDKKNGSACSSCSCMDFQIEMEKLSKKLKEENNK